LDGKHLSKYGKLLIDKLAGTMNNNRLSTSKKISLDSDLNFKLELELLEKSKPLIKIDSEGRALVLSEQK